MDSDFSFSRILFWCARSWAAINLLLLFYLYFVVGGGDTTASFGPHQWTLFAFFPLGVIAGLAIGWWKELLGAFLTIVGLGGFYVLTIMDTGRMTQGGWAFLFFAGPGFLYLLHALLLDSRQTEDQ